MGEALQFANDEPGHPNHHLHDLLRVPDLARCHLVGSARVPKQSSETVVRSRHVQRHGRGAAGYARAST